MTILNQETLQIGRGRANQVFRYLEALNQLRNPTKYHIKDYSWLLWFKELPKHPFVRKGIWSYPSKIDDRTNEFTEQDNFILKVKRPNVTPPPTPPVILKDWLTEGWEEPSKPVVVVTSQNIVGKNNETIIVRFQEDRQRVEALESWKPKRMEWAVNEQPAREALKLFERLYALYGQIEREAEKVELVLGDGMLAWKHSQGNVHHPILLQRLYLEFDPKVPEFTLRETETPVGLYTALFRNIAGIDGKSIAVCREELEKGDFHLLERENISQLLKTFIHRLTVLGEFVDGEIIGTKTAPCIGRDVVVFLRNRTLGFAVALEAIIQDIQDIQAIESIPTSLLLTVGVETPLKIKEEKLLNTNFDANEDEEILFSKPANIEQLQIAQRLEKYGSVLVQGPPGTGKTHTIANLIGYLLSQNKTVLITSHTTKALRVLRSQVVEQLQPLCISVLENDVDSREQLQNSVNAIVEKLSSADAGQLEREANNLKKQRSDIINKLKQSRDKLLKVITGEYKDIVIAGQSYTPSNAARVVSERQKVDNWIPTPVSLGAPLPLLMDEIIDLYRINAIITPDDEQELSFSLPIPEELINPIDFKKVVLGLKELEGSLLEWRKELWQGEENKSIYILNPLLEQMTKAIETIKTDEQWRLDVVLAGKQGGMHCDPWNNLIKLIDLVNEAAAKAQDFILQYGPTLPTEDTSEESIKILDEIIEYFNLNKKLGFFTLFTRPAWKKLIDKANVNGSNPKSLEHFQALRKYAYLQLLRKQLVERWERQIVPLGGHSLKGLVDRPEMACLQYKQPILDCLEWHSKSWLPKEKELKSYGLQWEKLLQEINVKFSPYSELLKIKTIVLNDLPDIIKAQLNRFNHKELLIFVESLKNKIKPFLKDGFNAPQVVKSLHEAVIKYDTTDYSIAYNRLLDLRNRSVALQKRQEYIQKMERSAYAWAAAIRDRKSPHNKVETPGDVQAAWLWRQLNDELQARSELSIERIQKEIEQLTEELHKATVVLTDRRAWAFQVKRTSLNQRQALVGFLKTIKKIGAGTGKRVPILQAEARKLLDECRSAVPVWIMPLSRVVESFSPKTTKFDVVIIDEASQSDVMGLIAFYLGKNVVIVGDDEQVSPDAVGQKLDDVQHLIDEHLHGIPNAHLYDGQTSIYDLAMASFGGTICLTEHFRCVPEIIQFSNHLSYSGRIKPLRDASSVVIKPHVISYRVQGAEAENKVNEIEAEVTASLLISALKQPEYAKSTFGVISLIGSEQAERIEQLLRTNLEPVEYQRHNIRCGNSAQFQGDERNVMFLSMVSGPEDGPLRMLSDVRFKKRFNVAASRARDQMWVIHSLNPEIDLKPGDLRRRLIEHAQDPNSLVQILDSEEKKTESEFERLVLRRLISTGYQAIPQWRVGYYWIDMVVIEGKKQLAIECDGDRYHPIEKLPEDMARQVILERLGWTFVRIRGSQFFRDPEKAMEPVWAKLRELNIETKSVSQNQPSNQKSPSELKERIIHLAEELRISWRNKETKINPSKEKAETKILSEAINSPKTSIPEIKKAENKSNINNKEHLIVSELPQASPKTIKPIENSLKPNIVGSTVLNQKGDTSIFEGNYRAVNSISCSPTKRYVLLGCDPSKESPLHVVDLQSGSKPIALKGHSYSVSGVAFSLVNQYWAVSAGQDKTVRVWNIKTGEELFCFKGHTAGVNSVDISPDQIVSGGRDKTIILWDIKQGKKINDFKGHTEYIMSVAFIPNSQYVVSGGLDNTIRLWNRETGQEIQCFDRHTDGINKITISKNGLRFISCSRDGTIKLWKVDGKREIQSLTGHTDWVNCADFTSDGSHVISGSRDRTIRVWDLEAKKELYSFKVDCNIHSLAVLNDSHILFGGSDGILRVLKIK